MVVVNQAKQILTLHTFRRAVLTLFIGSLLSSHFQIKKRSVTVDSTPSNPDIAESPDAFVNRKLLNEGIRKLAAEENPRVLNVHVVPHTHDDVGWLKTVDQYYQGLNSSIQRANVRSILTSVIESLLAHPSRTFSYVEQKFFQLWWSEQSDAVKDSVRMLVTNQQLVFLNGGWCMHDEASTHYISTIDQTTLGHNFLRRELGVIPRVGWQLDPFGHSATQASLFTSRSGMDALYFGRIDYQDRTLRKLTRECEGLWNASSSLPDTTVFWGLTGSYDGNYGPPPGFWFDTHTPEKSLVGADPDYVLKKVYTFLEYLRLQSDQTKGNHIMLTMGSDFHFERAEYNFENYDILVGNIMVYQALNKIDIPTIVPNFDRINIFYSNPEYYTSCKYRQTRRRQYDIHYKHCGNCSDNLHLSENSLIDWSIKTDDFFPYSDSAHSFWTGYFTSRTSFKRFERVASGFLQAARQIQVTIYNSWNKDESVERKGKELMQKSWNSLSVLEDALGIAQHHDSITGTAKQHVANDYSLRIQAGLDKTAEATALMLEELMVRDNESDLVHFRYCPYLNESVCEITELATRYNDSVLYIIVYNPMVQERSSIVRLPIHSKDTLFEVSRMDETDVTSSTINLVGEIDPLSCPCDEKHVLAFDTGLLPPLGAVAFRIVKLEGMDGLISSSIHEEGDWAHVSRRHLHLQDAASFESSLVHVISNGLLTARFDALTGTLKSMARHSAKLSTGKVVTTHASGVVDIAIRQDWGYYKSFDSEFDKSDLDNGGQRSGAYIFRPSEPEESLTLLTPDPLRSKVVNTSLGQEYHMEFKERWMKQTFRVLYGQPFLELEYLVGPIPIDDGRGKEIVSRIHSDIQSNGVFYTDSNGREFQRRKRNHRPSWDISMYEPVAGNYYPVNAAIYLEDDEAALAVLVDRSLGGASLTDGTLELMVQRRIVSDDDRGVDEALNETIGGITPYPPYGDRRRLGEGVTVRGIHRIFLSSNGGLNGSSGKSGSGGSASCRSAMDAVFAQPLVFFGSTHISHPSPFQKTSFAGMRGSLPPNVMLITFTMLFERFDRATPAYLVRLGHQYGVGEDESLSLNVQVDLALLFPLSSSIKTITEMTLSGNLEWNQHQQNRMRWANEESFSSYNGTGTVVVLTPMDIRTFVVTVQVNSSS